MSKQNNSGVIAAGLALFSMFFGAGDLIWPLILGGASGDHNFFAMLGLLITGVSLPLLGLISMMLFEGNYREFFGRVGKGPALILIFIVQAILGPVGSIPRLITLSYSSLKPYLNAELSLAIFSVFACFIVLAFTVKKQRLIDILGLVLTPILLISLTSIVVIGFWNPPAPEAVLITNSEAFTNGLKTGYNTLDLIASFIFAPLVLAHFTQDESISDPILARKESFKKMVKASLIAASLLSLMYISLTYVSSFYTQLLPENHDPAERLSAISMHLLGSYGALISSIAVVMACLTTAIPLTTICGDYIREELFRGRGGNILPLVITLAISGALANLGFMGIANMLDVILPFLCPSLIVLSILNIAHKLYEVKQVKVPVFASFGLSYLAKLYVV